MLDTMKKEISKDIKEANESGKIGTQEVEIIVEHAVAKTEQSAKAGKEAIDIQTMAKEALITAIQELKSAGRATKTNIKAVVNGTMKGINKSTKEALNDIDMELLKTKYRLEEQKDRLSSQLKDALNGAKEAASAFSAETKAKIEEAVTDAKLKSVEILGLMKETIKHSVKTVIDEGKDVEEKVAHITRAATENALSEGRLSAQKVKDVSEAAILAAIEAAQETGKEVKETTRGAVEGTKQGLTTTIEKAKEKLAEAKDKAEDLVEEDIKQTIKDFKAIDHDFIEALNNTTSKVGTVAREVLNESINKMRGSSSRIRKSAEEAANTAIEYLKRKGPSAKDKALKAAEIAKDEVKDVSEKMVKIAKGAFSGMVDGAKKAMKDDEEQ
ncbi:MAG: hypothetical protein J7J70_07065 [Deltaproteobacteria bacterium]|nr:hypothetical protein [Candidatus Tharpellaceae bacterium]